MQVKLLMMIACIVLLSFNSKCQNSIAIKYPKVDIDSLLKAPVKLPKAGYSITNIEFTAIYGKEAREISDPIRDRFLQFQDQFPQLKWEYTDTNIALQFKDTIIFVPLSGGREGRLFSLVDSWGDKFGPKIIVQAQMLIGKYERYGIKRDFLIKDIIVINQSKKKLSASH